MEARGAYFQLPCYKGQVENWSWHNVCHQFALHFNPGSRLSVIPDTFKCRFIDGVYIFDKLARSAAPGGPAAEIQLESSVKSQIHVTEASSRTQRPETGVLYLLDIIILSLVEPQRE